MISSLLSFSCSCSNGSTALRTTEITLCLLRTEIVLCCWGVSTQVENYLLALKQSLLIQIWCFPGMFHVVERKGTGA